MISVIICSRAADIAPAQRENIDATIGVPHEIVVIDNSQGRYSIFQAYNEGVRRAKGDLLCFMHDDLEIVTPGWGGHVERMFAADRQNENTLGMVGVIGCRVVPDCPASWFTGGLLSGHVWHRMPHMAEPDYLENGSDGGDEVAMVDGLWFCMPRAVFGQGVRFDEETYHGFHCYDSDICIQVLQAGKRILIDREIDIVHFSYGSINQVLIEQREVWYNKWKGILPLCRGVDLTRCEMDLVTDMAIRLNEWVEHVTMSEREVRRLQGTWAFRLGKAILRPFNWARNAIRRKG
ncbi:MAG: hypothetical protein IJ760_00780 [Bacteroidales bacterium]|nr:hypothetical protein [Bacteroidales bacterium]